MGNCPKIIGIYQVLQLSDIQNILFGLKFPLTKTCYKTFHTSAHNSTPNKSPSQTKQMQEDSQEMNILCASWVPQVGLRHGTPRHGTAQRDWRNDILFTPGLELHITSPSLPQPSLPFSPETPLHSTRARGTLHTNSFHSSPHMNATPNQRFQPQGPAPQQGRNN